MPRPNLFFESSCAGIVAGIDEAGRGPWAGPVVAAAVILDRKRIPGGIDDSKKLSRERREDLFEQIIRRARVGLGCAEVGEIDALNILGATKLAMCRAFAQIAEGVELALVDGNHAPQITCRVQTIVEGDAKCLSIAAASIIAKVTRDRLMRDLAAQFPGYGWETNAGYGTMEHQRALVQYGITPHHRRSFAPIRALMEATDLFSYVPA